MYHQGDAQLLFLGQTVRPIVVENAAIALLRICSAVAASPPLPTVATPAMHTCSDWSDDNHGTTVVAFVEEARGRLLQGGSSGAMSSLGSGSAGVNKDLRQQLQKFLDREVLLAPIEVRHQLTEEPVLASLSPLGD